MAVDYAALSWRQTSMERANEHLGERVKLY
jgi:hypothetical protein